jgi:hypothetical protein
MPSLDRTETPTSCGCERPVERPGSRSPDVSVVAVLFDDNTPIRGQR